MNEVCEQLAQTGLNLYSIVAIAIALISIGYVGICRKSVRPGSFFAALYFLLAAIVSPFFMSGSAFAQSASNCPPTNSPSTPQAPPVNENAVQALNDGPFTIGTNESNIIFINVLNNDSPGTSTFNLATLDLDPSTPEIDNYYEYDDGVRSGTFTHFDTNGVVRFQPSTLLSVGDTIATPYTVRTMSGELAGPANILIEVVDNIAQGDRVNFCGTNEYDYLLPASNDYHPSGLNLATIDLNPALPGIQTAYSHPDGILYEVDVNGEITVTLPVGGLAPPSSVNLNTVIYYTIQANDGTTSNQAPIWLHWAGECGAG